MSDEVVGKLRLETEVDQSGIDKGLAEADQKVAQSGAQAEKSVSKISTLSKAGVAAVAGAGALMFGVAAKGAVELEDATANFRAETGATAEEAKRAGQAIADMSRSNLQGIGEIGEVLTKVHTDLGLTGEEAEKTTERFLKFATATKQDAASAVLAFDDLLDAFNLEASDSQGIMDQLVLSHQKFGGSVEQSQAALAAIAPALNTMNMGVDDGIALLNLFASKGLSAESAQKALNAAVKNLPPGEDLNDLVARLGSIQDPAQRAQVAIDVLGAKAGVAFANAIEPGMSSLDTWKVTAEEAKGASDEAAAAIEGSFGNKIKLMLNDFKGALAGIGQEFGPLIMAMGSLGTMALPLAAKLGVTTAAVKAQTLALKEANGGWTGMVKAIGPAGLALGAITVGLIAAHEADKALAEQHLKTIEAIKGVTSATDEEIAATKIAAEEMLRRADNMKLFGIIDTEASTAARAAAQAALDQANALDHAGDSANNAAVATHAASERAENYAASLDTATARLDSFDRVLFQNAANQAQWAEISREAAQEVARGFNESREGLAEDYRETIRFAGQAAETQALNDARAIGKGVPGEIGRGMQDEANEVFDAAAVLRDILKNGTSPEGRANDFIENGKKYVRLLRDGMNSEKDGARETAQQLAIGAINTIEDAGLTGAKGQRGLRQIGIYYDQLLAGGMNANEAAAALAAGGVGQATIDALQGKSQQFYRVGATFVDRVTAAIRAGRDDVARAINYSFGSQMRGQSPPERGPLREAILSAPKVARSYIDHFNSGLKGLAFPSMGGIRPLAFSGAGFNDSSAPAAAAAYSPHYHFHIGQLIADDAGLAELGRRIEHVTGFEEREPGALVRPF